MTDPVGHLELELKVTGASAGWRRLAGPAVWSTLTGLALAAVPDGDGWFAPVGVRQLAGLVGLNKDTAARAVAALAAAGMVTRERAVTPDGASRSGYRLALPDGISLGCPNIPDTARYPRSGDGPCPTITDGGARPNVGDAHPARSHSSQQVLGDDAGGPVVDAQPCRVAETVNVDDQRAGDDDRVELVSVSRSTTGHERAPGARRSGTEVSPRGDDPAVPPAAESGVQGELFCRAAAMGEAR